MIRDASTGDINWKTLAAVIAVLVGLITITGSVSAVVIRTYQIEAKTETNCRDISTTQAELKELRIEAQTRLRAVETNQREVLSDVRWMRKFMERDRPDADR